jgi:hypothetical protein
MRYLWFILVGVLCLALTGCPEKEADDNVVNDQEGMRKPGEEPTPTELDAAEDKAEDAIGGGESMQPGTPPEGTPGDGTAPPAEGEGGGEAAPPAEGEGTPPAEGEGTPPKEGEGTPPAEGEGGGGEEPAPPAEGGK